MIEKGRFREGTFPAHVAGRGPDVTFGDLKVGDRFANHGMDLVYQKVSPTAYRVVSLVSGEPGGRRYKKRDNSSVIRVNSDATIYNPGSPHTYKESKAVEQEMKEEKSEKEVALAMQKKGYMYALVPTRGSDKRLQFAKDLSLAKELVKDFPGQRYKVMPIQKYLRGESVEESSPLDQFPVLSENAYPEDPSGPAKKKQQFVQYRVTGNSFVPMGKDPIKQDTLSPGVYRVDSSLQGVYFEIHDFKTDQLLRFEDERLEGVLEEIDEFWNQRESFEEMGFSHKRGILLHGIPGSGKSCLLKLAMEATVERGDVVFIAKSAGTLVRGLSEFRDVEPNRRVLVVLEDIDEIIRYGEHAILELFDGDSQVDHVLYISTTNYLDRLPPRIVREGRFDTLIEVENPPEAGRLAYFQSKLGLREEEGILDQYAKDMEGFSFAQMREFLVSVYCLKRDPETTIERIRKRGGIGLSEERVEELFSGFFAGSPLQEKVQWRLSERIHTWQCSSCGAMNSVARGGQRDRCRRCGAPRPKE